MTFFWRIAWLSQYSTNYIILVLAIVCYIRGLVIRSLFPPTTGLGKNHLKETSPNNDGCHLATERPRSKASRLWKVKKMVANSEAKTSFTGGPCHARKFVELPGILMVQFLRCFYVTLSRFVGVLQLGHQKGHFESPFVSVFRLLSAWKSGKRCAKYEPHPAVCSTQIIFIAWIQFGKSLRNQAAYYWWIHPHHLEWGTCASSPSWLFNKEEARSQRTPPVQYIITVLPGKKKVLSWGDPLLANYSEKEQASQDSSCRLKSSEVWWPTR